MMGANARDWRGVLELSQQWTKRVATTLPSKLADLNAEFTKKLRAKFPTEVQDVRQWGREGRLLSESFKFALLRILGRVDLTEGEKAIALASIAKAA
jgi:hypothetical protein